MIDLFLTRLPHPVCLVAHYGNKFHYSLLQTELRSVDRSLPPTIQCVDSWEFFNENTSGPGFRLVDIYERCFGNLPPVTNRAEVDCANVVKVVKNYSRIFTEWCDDKAISLESIEPMYWTEVESRRSKHEPSVHINVTLSANVFIFFKLFKF